jgi:hypothetical protein
LLVGEVVGLQVVAEPVVAVLVGSAQEPDFLLPLVQLTQSRLVLAEVVVQALMVEQKVAIQYLALSHQPAVDMAVDLTVRVMDMVVTVVQVVVVLATGFLKVGLETLQILLLLREIMEELLTRMFPLELAAAVGAGLLLLEVMPLRLLEQTGELELHPLYLVLQ